MVDKNLGSLALDIFNSISPMPAGVSGLLVTIVENQSFFINQWTGKTIATTIQDQYKLPLTDLSTANVLKLMASQDMGVQSVSIGDLSTNNSNLAEMARQFETKGMFELKSLSKEVKFTKARG